MNGEKRIHNSNLIPRKILYKLIFFVELDTYICLKLLINGNNMIVILIHLHKQKRHEIFEVEERIFYLHRSSYYVLNVLKRQTQTRSNSINCVLFLLIYLKQSNISFFISLQSLFYIRFMFLICIKDRINK